MNDKKDNKALLEKLPYGIFSGICAMITFYATLGLVAAYLILSAIAAQTSDKISFLQNSWQVVLFVFDIIFFVLAIFNLVMYILRVRGFFSKNKIRNL
ncbi:MAG TPA: hypothetical protein VIL26_09190 [Clostridia bacterium]